MGLGDTPLGTAPLGLDGQVTTTIIPVRRVAAMKIDGQTKDFVAAADGQNEFVHPIDQAMFNICRMTVGSVRSSSGTGNTIALSKYIDRNSAQAMVDDRIARAASHLTSTGEVTILRNEVDTSVRGRLGVRVNYQNNITGKKSTVNA
jgi:hypothetical protein